MTKYNSTAMTTILVANPNGPCVNIDPLVAGFYDMEISIQKTVGIPIVELFKVIVYPNISAPLTFFTIDLVDLRPRTK